MIEEDRYCIDISNQIQAAQAILGKANAEVLKAHVHHCVRAAVAQGDACGKLDEISLILEKLAKNNCPTFSGACTPPPQKAAWQEAMPLLRRFRKIDDNLKPFQKSATMGSIKGDATAKAR